MEGDTNETQRRLTHRLWRVGFEVELKPPNSPNPLHRLVLRHKRQADFEVHRRRASNRHISMIMREAGGFDIEVVDVRWDVCELKLLGNRGFDLPAVYGQVVG